MKKNLSRFLLIFLALILILSIGLIGFVYTFDIAKYKTEIIEAFNDNTGLRLSIEGDLSLGVDEGLFLSLNKVTLRDSLGIVAQVDTLNLIIPIRWPSGIINVKSAEVISPVYHFRTKGIIPFKTELKDSYRSSFITPSIVIDGFRIDSVSVTDGRFILYNRKDSIYLDVRNIKAVDANFAMLGFDDILTSFDVNATAHFDHISAFGLTANNGNCRFRMIDGTLDFDSEYVRNQKGEFDINLDLNPEDIRYHIKGISRGENVRDLFLNARESVDWVKGKYNGSYDVKFKLADSTIDLASMSGTVQLESENTRLYGISLDKMVKSFKRTQKFSFKDLGSVMVFGPWGLALSKGGDYAELARASQKDSTLIEYLHCQLSIDTGMLEFQDLAFRTRKNRIALMGSIDFLNSSYHRFSYALIDKEGCSVIREEYNGPFEQASSEGISNFAILMGPVTNLFQSTGSRVLRNDCERVYSGVVKAPEKKKGFFKRLASKKR